MAKSYRIAAIPGDGIGTEVIAAGLEVLAALAAMGKAAPQDIGVAGFGNFEVARFCSPSISTVTVDPLQIGREAGRLIGRLLGDPSARVEHIDAQVDITLRDSTR